MFYKIRIIETLEKEFEIVTFKFKLATTGNSFVWYRNCLVILNQWGLDIELRYDSLQTILAPGQLSRHEAMSRGRIVIKE